MPQVNTFGVLRQLTDDGGWEQRLIQEVCDADLARIFSLKLIDVPDEWVRLQCVLQLATDLASGLDYLHARGVIHGDVNPRNVLILLKPEALPLGCVAKLADFGLASQLGEGQAYVSDVHHGTPFYASPEVTRNGMLYLQSDTYGYVLCFLS